MKAGNPGGRRLRVALAGAGYFSAFHADAWRRNPEAELVGIADPDLGKAQRLAEAEGTADCAVFTDAGAMFARLAPDIVDIAAPPSVHLDLIVAALEADPAAIVCQKPFCGDLAQARRAVSLARDRGRLLIVHENFRFQPWYRLVRAQLAAGLIGEPYQMTFRLRPGDGQGRDAYLARQPYFQEMPRFLVHETAVHWIDTFRFLFGEPASVYADLRRLNPAIAGEDAGHFIYGYADGRRALFDGNRLADHAADDARLTMGEFLLEGSRGTLGIDGFGRVLFRPFGARAAEALAADHPRDRFGGDCVFALQKHVTDHLLHGGAVENEAAAYLRNMEIEAAIYRSAEEGRKIELGA